MNTIYYFVENLKGFGEIAKTEIEYGEIDPEYFQDKSILTDVSILKPGDKVYSLDAGAYNLYRID